jgi:aspartyl-tRNA(Asn)/glutamyl-tRNA(Gln) amidotransferase subunit A
VSLALAKAQTCQSFCNAFAAIAEDEAMAAARLRDSAPRRARKLDGLPVLLKDNIDTADIVTAYGSRAYENHLPKNDAAIVRRLRAEGAVIVGKTTTHEFAWGVTTQSTAYGPTRNPHDRSRIPGGSSGGLAVAVASGVAAAGIGSDTGGSIRIPAALCGVVGFKPSAGLWSAEGIFPLAPTLDHPGIIAASVEDVIMLAAALGLDAVREVANPKIEFLERLPDVPVSEEVKGAFHRALEMLRATFTMEASSLALLFSDLYSVFAGTVLAEGGMVHFARSADTIIDALYDPETRTRLELARGLALGDYQVCQERRRSFVLKLDEAFRSDFLMLPSCACTAPPIGKDEVAIGPWSGTVREALMANTLPFNLSGYPAISLPLPVAPRGLPVGLQIVAKPGRDAHLLRFAAAVESKLNSLRETTAPTSKEIGDG